jgi:hypothetical protein
MLKHRQITSKMIAADINTRLLVSDIPASGGIVIGFGEESNSKD